MLNDIISTYHDLLTDDLARESQHRMEEVQRQRGLAFGARPLCTVLRPRFLTPDQYQFLSRRVARLMPAFAKAQQAAFDDPAVQAQFMLTPEEEQLVRHDPGFACAYPTARLDAFFASENELFFTEFNAETPAAPAYHDNLSEVFLGLPVMGEFQRRFRVTPLPARHGVLHALLHAYQQWLGLRALPRIAILDWREVPTYYEFVLFQQYFRSQGLECVIADPREVEYRGGKLWAAGYPIDLIYKRVLIGELLERCGMDHAVVRAVRDNAVCMVNPFRCKLLYKKASFAVLSDERNAALFNAAELEAIQAHIPWTRRVEERKATHAGAEVDLVPYIVQNRERFVLKPNDDYGGKGIVLGWTVDETDWEAAVRVALATPYVVQQRVTLPSEPFAAVFDGKVQIHDRMLDTAPFVWDGTAVEGCLTRISTAALLNVTAGGGSTVPTFLVERRS